MTRVSLADAKMEERPNAGSVDGGARETMQADEESNAIEHSPRMKEGGEKKFIVTEAGSHEHLEWPALTVETATPTPHPLTPDINDNKDDSNKNILTAAGANLEVVNQEDEEEDMEELSEDGGEEEEVEEIIEDPEMTPEEKKDMYECVKSGDIDSLEDCLDLPNSDINMIWFKENLLMTAIRHGQQEMSEFLLDNGVDHTYETSIMGMRDTNKGKVLERYQLNCRQMAYDKEMFDIVDIIDSLQGKLFPFVRLPERTQRLRRPRPPTPSLAETGSGESSSEGADVSSSGESDEEGKEVSEGKSEEQERKLKKRMKKKTKKKKSAAGRDGVDTGKMDGSLQGVDAEDLDGDAEKNKTIGGGSGVDVDSGHHSLGSGKLKMALLKEHDRLMEREEREEEERERFEASHNGSSGRQHPARAKVLPAGDSNSKDIAGSAKSQAQGESKLEGSIERGASADLNRTHDEGYGGSVSLKSRTPVQPSPPPKPPEPVRPWDAAPKNRIRSTKSALVSRRSMGLQHNKRVLSGVAPIPQRFNEAGFSSSLHLDLEQLNDNDTSDSPLRWRKVSTTGSYARESKQWHRVQPERERDLPSPRISVEISEINLCIPNSCTNSNTAVVSTLSLSSVSSASLGLPKSIIKPTVLASPLTADSATATEARSVPSQQPLTMASNRTASGQGKPSVAGYMRATKSTSIKCRLPPKFASSYGALDFQAKSAAGDTCIRRIPSKAKLDSSASPSPKLSLSSSPSTSSPSSSMRRATENGRQFAAMTMTLASSPMAKPVVSHQARNSYVIPVITSSVKEHQKRNESAISFRS